MKAKAWRLYGALAGGRAVYGVVKTKPEGLQFHDVAAATDAIADDIKRVMEGAGGRVVSSELEE